MFSTPVSALVRRPPVRIARGAPLREAVALLRQGTTRCVVVVDGERAVGLLTDRGLVEKCYHEGISGDTPVEVVMDAPLFTVLPDASVLAALRLVDDERLRNLPLVEQDGTLRALIRGRDLMEYIAESMPELVLNQPPTSARPSPTREGA